LSVLRRAVGRASRFAVVRTIWGEVESASERRRERFEALFGRYHAEVAAYVRRRARTAIVEDVVAETFLVAWRSLDRLDGDPLPWLYGVAWRVLANELRGRRRRSALNERLAHEAGPGEWVPLAAEVSGRVRAALLALGEREREAVLLVSWEGLSPAQAAVAAGCSGPAFRARLYRARRQLSRALSEGVAAGAVDSITREAGEA
jgi:RNA polymerase sigma factor (sigma-70 family)